MSMLCHRFGQTTVAKVRDAQDLRQLLVDPWLESETIIIKPNWVSTGPASFTDSKALRMLLEALDAHFVVTESHAIGRSFNLLKDGMPFTVGDQEVNWRWLFRGEGWNWLMEHRDWDWFKEGEHYAQIRKEEKAFLDTYGFTDLFNAFDVTYVNVTDEVWSGRIADPMAVKQAVESLFTPISLDALYRMVPQTLYDLRGSTFISFAKLKYFPSFTIKNLFGMIPDPSRPWWHGPRHRRRGASIIDVNKVYHALFNVYGICEALHTRAVPHPDGEVQSDFLSRRRYNVRKSVGFVACSRDLVSLDALLCTLAGFDVKSFWGYIKMAEEVFGAYDREVLTEAVKTVGTWLAP